MAVQSSLDKVSQKLEGLNSKLQQMFQAGGSQASAQNVGGYLQAAGLGKAGGTMKMLGGKDPLTGIISEVSSRLGTAKDEFGSVLGAKTPTRAVGHLGRGVEAVTSHIPGMGMPGKMVGIIAESIEKLREWTDSLHNANMQFADFSAAMASVEAEQQARDIQLKRQQGNNRADSARELAEARSKVDRQFAPVEDAWAKFQNFLGTKVEQAKSAGLSAVGLNGDGSGGNATKVGDEISASQWMALLGEDERETRARRPKRLQ